MILRSVRETKECVLLTAVSDLSENGGEEFFLSPSEWKRVNRLLGYDPDAGLFLRAGALLDEVMLGRLREAAQRTGALRAAAAMLSQSDHSRAQLIRRLRAKGYPEDAAQSALERLEQKGFFDEESACRRYAEAILHTKRYGRRRILDALLAKRYPSELARAAVDDLDEEELRAALRDQIRRKCPALAERPCPLERAQKQKAISALMRLGFSAEEILEAIRGE
ncbi:MAG: regulatory protein RecX [Clostridia bacterium]|nr:regulatory protein RecX [Clostridia bacterium]